MQRNRAFWPPLSVYGEGVMRGSVRAEPRHRIDTEIVLLYDDLNVYRKRLLNAVFMPTIRDVAARANVSVATVSHVINGTRPVHPETVKRVRAAIEDLGYRQNTLARGLRRSETGTIGLLVPDNSNPFFAEVSRVIEDRGFSEGYNVILCNSDGSAAKEAAYVEVLLSKQVDGLILISSGNSFAPVQSILKVGVPLVVVDRELGDLPVDQVLVDNEQGGYLVGQYLVRLGHRRIGYISGPSNLSLSAHRLAGFKRALDEAGIALSTQWIIRGDFQYAGGESAMRKLLQHNLKLTAVFASNDRMALGAMAVLSRARLRIPEDVSVIGFDDIPLARATFPSLTTVAQPIADMGHLSVSLLLDRIKKEKALPPQRIMLPTSLIERQSCRVITRAGPTPKNGVLNHQLSEIIASMGDADGLVIGASGLAVPSSGVPFIDLAVSPGLPALLDVARAVGAELAVERLVVATELMARGESLPIDLQACFPNAKIDVVPDQELRALTNNARVVIRTGELMPYANVIVYSGATG
jgi:LacI family transcriptional regulator